MRRRQRSPAKTAAARSNVAEASQAFNISSPTNRTTTQKPALEAVRA
jgi:hypothetical protein